MTDLGILGFPANRFVLQTVVLHPKNKQKDSYFLVNMDDDNVNIRT